MSCFCISYENFRPPLPINLKLFWKREKSYKIHFMWDYTKLNCTASSSSDFFSQINSLDFLQCSASRTHYCNLALSHVVAGQGLEVLTHRGRHSRGLWLILRRHAHQEVDGAYGIGWGRGRGPLGGRRRGWGGGARFLRSDACVRQVRGRGVTRVQLAHVDAGGRGATPRRGCWGWGRGSCAPSGRRIVKVERAALSDSAHEVGGTTEK